MDVVIGPAVAGEAAQILGLQRLCYRSEAELYDDWSIPPMTQTLPGLLAEYEDHEVLVARLGDEVVGSVRGREDDGTCRVGRLIVHPRLQRAGIGSRLMGELEGRFPRAERFELFTGHKSEGNLRLYRRLGYERLREQEVSPRLRLVFLQKALGRPAPAGRPGDPYERRRERAVSTGGGPGAGLGRTREAMAVHVGRGGVPGLVWLVSRRGEAHAEAIGAKAVEGDPMRRDTIFRVSSLTKPVAAAAAMVLVEDGVLRLDEPVDRLLPELADRRVLRRLDGPLDDTVPARRPITLRDLLTMRMGFGFVMGPPDAYPILAAAEERRLGMGPPKPATPHGPDGWIRRFAELPLMHQPGERWTYETAFAVLGVLISRAAEKPLEAFLRECIFGPLGMEDTGFHVPAEKLGRLASLYAADPETGALGLYDGAEDSQWGRPPAFPDARGGLVSTADDYLAFGRMMLDGGEHGGERVLSRASVGLMTTDHLTPELRSASDHVPVFLGGRGWGFGLSTIPGGDGASATPGRYGWEGGLGTSWSSDPDGGLVGVLMTQLLASPGSPRIDLDFWASVYGDMDG